MTAKNTPPPSTPESLATLLQQQDPRKLQVLLTTLALANTESLSLLNDVMAGSGPISTMFKGDELGTVEAFQAVAKSHLLNPTHLINANMKMMLGYVKLMQEMATPANEQDPDRRFSDPEWKANPGFRMMRKAYDLNAEWFKTLAETSNAPDELRRRAKFFTQQLTDTLSPTNFLGSNPVALRAFIESGGESVLNGIRMARDDIRRAGGKLQIKQSDESPFKVGENIATAPGKVVFRNDLMELIQYAPTQKKTYARPLLIFPPWINKFYVLDMRKENSMIRWLVDKGLTVFVVSWRSADTVTKDYTWDDYAEQGIYAAVDAALEASNAKKVNAVGYCIGGTLLSGTLSHMAKSGDKRINSATFFASQSDFEIEGDLHVFTDKKARKHISGIIEKNGGVMPGKQMEETFNWLRPIDLVWRYVIDQYMLGKPPKPFDLLYWNADQTNIPGPVHKKYLKDMYAKNKLARGKFKLMGETVDPKDVKIPVLVQAGRDDHICPYASVFRTAQVFGGKSKFVLTGSGHIAGVVNHPDSNKYQHWVSDADMDGDADDWIKTATEIPGSWWPTWWDWLKPKSGKLRDAVTPKDVGLGDAPGAYVKVRLEDIKLPIK